MAKALITAEERTALPEVMQAEYPEPIADEASPNNGMFLLKVDTISGFALENVAGLKATVSARQADNDTLKAENGQLKASGETQAARITELEAIDPASEADRLAEERVKSTTEQMKARHTEELQVKDTAILKLQGGLQNALIRSEAVTALTDQKGSVKLLLDGLMARCKLKERPLADNSGTEFYAVVLDDAGNPKIADAQGTEQTIAQHVTEMKADPDFARAFDGTEASGAERQTQVGTVTPTPAEGDKTSMQKITDGLKAQRDKAA